MQSLQDQSVREHFNKKKQHFKLKIDDHVDPLNRSTILHNWHLPK